jgi:hypothetical protein
VNTLTDDQAALFRRLRPTVRPLRAAVSDLVSAVLTACGHTEGEHPDCPVCRVYEMARDADNALRDLPDAVDAALLAGPHPAARGRKRKDV